MSASDTVTQDDVDKWFDDEGDESQEDVSNEPPDPATKYAKSQLRVVRETKDYQLDYLRHALQPGKQLIDTAPDYQRRLRWTTKQRSLLIESFLLNIPVPPVYLFERDYNAYEVIDGRQRIETIRAFLSNNFALSSLEYWPELNRQRFNDLPSVLQKGLLRRSLPAVVLLAETHGAGVDDIDVRRVLFDRLNTGGIRLNPQELRNALYPGALNAMLNRLARSAPFTIAWGIPSQTPNEENEPSEALLKNPLFASHADAELVLRFFALRDAIANKRTGGLRRILDRYMETNKDLSTELSTAFEAEYNSLLKRLVDLFNGEPFRLPATNRVSRPLYDALMIALSQTPNIDLIGRSHTIRAELKKALEDEKQYDILVGRGNTLQAAKDRVSLASRILNAT